MIAGALLGGAKSASAVDVVPHATGEAAIALTEPQSREFGLGGRLTGGLELLLAKPIGLELSVGGLLLTAGKPPVDGRLEPKSTGTAFTVMPGMRLHLGNLWLAGGGGFVQTGDSPRGAVDAHLGYDFRFGRVGIGPEVGYLQVIQADDNLRPEDARLLTFGAHFALYPARPDRDGDKVYDDEDACPDTPGIRTKDPKTNGCPRRDRDLDGIFDHEDACPDVPGIHTNDPATNGCPRGDRDKDAVYDDEDACIDVPGVRTTDPKTNGCPPADGSIRIEGERIVLDDVILFDLDSPRVRRASWPTVERVAKFIIKTSDVLEISIEGHADAVGGDNYNLKLSRARAESVRTLLVKYGVPAEQVKAEAFGRSRLKVQTAHAERLNRRVEFWITRTKSGGSQ